VLMFLCVCARESRWPTATDAVKARMQELETLRDSTMHTIGNLVHDSVPVSSDEKDNRIERTWGDITADKKYSHYDLLYMIDAVDMQRGTAVAGSRGYFLRGPGVVLQMALFQHGLQMMLARNYTPLYAPFFMRKEVMQEVAQLSQFDTELYKVTGKRSEVAEDTDVEERYLIATR
jgi:seryl-tRNA synthetase